MLLHQLMMLQLLLLCTLTARSLAFGLGNLCATTTGTDCCPGWRRDTRGVCSVPVCDGDCGADGHCVGPNLCYCPDGVVQYSCRLRRGGGSGSGGGGGSFCARPCQNGGHCQGGRCECPAGYSGSACQFASCPNFCSGHGRCTASGVCSCHAGFSGAACDVVDKGPCYSGLSASGSCTGKLSELFISREECCNSFGRAWGSGCRPCGGASGCGFGRVSEGRSCAKLNFCSVPGICNSGSGGSNSGACIPDGDRDIICLCPSGMNFNRDERRCELEQNFCDRNLGICGRGGRCVDIPGSSQPGGYRCDCFPGYELRASDSKLCTERAPDPCTSNPTLCRHGSCISSSSGSSSSSSSSADFHCRCDAGFEAAADGRSCHRQTYCSVNPGACGPGGDCVPSGEDLFYCRCRRGYRATFSGLDCLPDVETTAAITTTPSPPADLCSSQRTCPVNTGDCLALTSVHYVCLCRDGHRQSADQRACEPTPRLLADAPAAASADPCAVGGGRCANGRCVQDPASRLGGFRCVCNDGFAASTTTAQQDCDRRVPPPLLFCNRHPSTCGVNGRCVSVSESDFYCSCRAGFRQAEDRRSCVPERSSSVDINPCQVFDICANGACLNLGHGAFQCLCYRGFELSRDRQNCQLKAPPPPTRGPRPTAKPTPPPTAVQPPTGFPLPSDPLQRLFHKSYCQKFSYVCGQGHCLDLDGSHQFTCACAPGYRLSHDKRFCVRADMRETGHCAENPGACGGMGHCVNSPGTQLFQCFCYPGFRNVDPKRRRCQPYDYNADTNKVVIHGMNSRRPGGSSSGASVSGGGGGGSYAHLGSPDAGGLLFDMVGSVKEVGGGGSGGGGGGGGGSRRRDVEASGGGGSQYAQLGSSGGGCETLGDASGLCRHGWCLERGAGFECACGLGFKQAADIKSCLDIDECQVAGKDICLMGRCVNTVGSYTCECQPGFRLEASTKLCRDRNECLEQPSICRHGDCLNLWGTHECRCHAGYRPSNASRQACEPEPPAFSMAGSVSVRHPECPDCLHGCQRERPGECRCQQLGGGRRRQVLMAGIVCAPAESRYRSLDPSAGQLQLYLASSSATRDVAPARRSVHLKGCREVSRSARYSLVQCDFSGSAAGA